MVKTSLERRGSTCAEGLEVVNRRNGGRNHIYVRFTRVGRPTEWEYLMEYYIYIRIYIYICVYHKPSSYVGYLWLFQPTARDIREPLKKGHLRSTCIGHRLAFFARHIVSPSTPRAFI